MQFCTKKSEPVSDQFTVFHRVTVFSFYLSVPVLVLVKCIRA